MPEKLLKFNLYRSFEDFDFASVFSIGCARLFHVQSLSISWVGIGSEPFSDPYHADFLTRIMPIF